MPQHDDAASGGLADWLQELLEERAALLRSVVSTYRGLDEQRQVETGAGDRFREALLGLADLEAKVRLVELHRGGHACRTERAEIAPAADVTDWTQRYVEWSVSPCLTLRLIAAPFWGWPGWRESWAL